MKERLSKHARFSDRNHVKAGVSRTGKRTCELMAERRVEKERIEKEKIDIAHPEREKMLSEANEFLR